MTAHGRLASCSMVTRYRLLVSVCESECVCVSQGNVCRLCRRDSESRRVARRSLTSADHVSAPGARVTAVCDALCVQWAQAFRD
jgi:hypothetical protein